MTSDTELSEAMLRWAQSVTKQLINSLCDTSIVGSGGAGWMYEQDGRIVYGSRNAHFKPWLIENALYKNEEWETLERLIPNHARMAMHCDVPVGTPYHGSNQYSARDFCYRLLPRPSIGDQGIFLEDVEGTARRIAELISEFNTDHITLKSVWPVCGMRVSEPIHLGEGQAFRSLTIAEKLSALNFKMIEPDEGETVIGPGLTDWYGFVLTEHFKKHFGHIDTPADFMEKFNRREKCLELFLTVAPVVGEFVAYHGGGLTNAPHFSSLGLLSRGETGYGAGHRTSRFLVPDLSPMLTDEQMKRFTDIWKLVSQTGPKNSGPANALRNAIRSIFYAETRTSPEDRLVDLMIAAESIYTMESKTELSYRLSLNAALWHDGTSRDRRKVFMDVKKAYTLRSNIVHGSSVDGNEVALAASSIRILLKAGIAKAIDSHFAGEFPPKWEDLPFPATD